MAEGTAELQLAEGQLVGMIPQPPELMVLRQEGQRAMQVGMQVQQGDAMIKQSVVAPPGMNQSMGGSIIQPPPQQITTVTTSTVFQQPPPTTYPSDPHNHLPDGPLRFRQPPPPTPPNARTSHPRPTNPRAADNGLGFDGVRLTSIPATLKLHAPAATTSRLYARKYDGVVGEAGGWAGVEIELFSAEFVAAEYYAESESDV